MDYPRLIVILMSLLNVSSSHQEILKLLKQKLKEYYNEGKPQVFPPYAAHELMILILSSNDFVMSII